MAHARSLPNRSWMFNSTSLRRTRLFSVFAGMVAVGILAANILLLPVPYLGVEIDPRSHAVTNVELGSSADLAGIRVGDHVVHLYDRPIEDVFNSLTVIGWIPPRDQSIPIVIERNGQERSLRLAQHPPVLESQAFILAMAGLALLCWITGYVLGVGRTQSILESQVAAYFWIGISAVLGSLPFALATSLPLLLVLAWVTAGILMPLSVYMHVFFPPRSQPTRVHRHITWYIAGAVLFLNGGLLALIMIARPTLIDVLVAALHTLPIVLVLGFGSSAVILWRAYRHTVDAHTRRQIRLVAAACGIVACGWIAFYVLPSLTLRHRLIPPSLLSLLCGLVPLAYLTSLITRDLYRLDRLARRCLVHSATIMVLGALLFLVASQLHLWRTPASTLLALTFVVLYRPVQDMVSSITPGGNPLIRQQIALDQVLGGLAQTLELEHLVATLAHGVRTVFNQPAFAIYAGDIYGSNNLHLRTQERILDVPAVISPGVLTELLCHAETALDSRQVYQRARAVTLTPDEQQIVANPRIAVWGPIRDNQGHLLGLLLLGMRGDLDPYRPEDQAVVQRLLNTASLAFANSAAFTRQQESENTIRHLYRRLQTSQDATARALAQELHDEIINVHVRLDIQSMSRIAEHNRDPVLQDDINIVLDSLRMMSDDLRRICEEVYPTGLNDVFGLGAVLRDRLYHEQSPWLGRCSFEETGTPLPIAPPVQREALRIMREAVTNAIKHASATTIMVRLAYPTAPSEPIQLIVSDNGQAKNLVREHSGHLGFRYMRESASAVGGTLDIKSRAGSGTQVIFSFWPTTRPIQDVCLRA